MRENILAAIDVGSSKVCTLVAEVTPESDLRILGVGITPAQGVKKGMVDNIQEATAAIANSVERAERSSGARVVSAHVSHFYKAMQFLKSQRHRFRFEDMLTNSYPLAQVTEALESMAALREIKPAILPELG